MEHMTTLESPGRETWLPGGRFNEKVGSHRNLQAMNDQGLLPVNFDVSGARALDIETTGVQTRGLGIWEFKSRDHCVTTPRPNMDLLAVHFIISGQITYRFSDGEAARTSTTAFLANLNTIRYFQNSMEYSCVGALLCPKILIGLNNALTGGDEHVLPAFSTSADVTTASLKALFCTLKLLHRLSLEPFQQDDFIFCLLQELFGYQLISAWPKKLEDQSEAQGLEQPDRLSAAKQFIQDNLAEKIRLSDVANASSWSVRALQDNFRRTDNLTPLEYIINQRLLRVHQDLISKQNFALSIKDIANRWGFVHMSDFAQRYRSLFGCTPTTSRRDAF